MGERAIEEPATAAEIEQIAALAGQSVAEGALGFSVNRHPGHTLPDRRPIPGTFASREEMVAIAKAVGERGGLMQVVPNFGKVEEEMDLLAGQRSQTPHMCICVPLVRPIATSASSSLSGGQGGCLPSCDENSRAA